MPAKKQTTVKTIVRPTKAAPKPRPVKAATKPVVPAAMKHEAVEPEIPERVPSGLRTTDIPGVYRNRQGTQVDARGVMLSFTRLKQLDAARFAEVVEEPVASPAQLLRAVSLDPRQPLDRRLAAAVKAAPYYDQKKPIQVEGGDPAKPVRMLSETKLAGMSDAELGQLAALLGKAESAE